MTTNPIVQLNGDMIALQIIVQRILGHMALASGHPVQSVMRAEHQQASAELAAADLVNCTPAAAEEMRDHAQSVIDSVYAVAATTRAGPAPATKKGAG